MEEQGKYKFKVRQRIYLFFKRIIDIFGSTIGIIVLSPLMLIIAIIIKCCSKGPVLFVQERYGRNMKIFKIYKFRTMHVGTKDISAFKIDEEQLEKMTYPFGRFLRKTSMDEIPNLFNVFLGHISFIGPRAEMIHGEKALYNERLKYTPNAFDVKPGISSYSIIKMQRGHDIQLKAKYDSEYVEKLSFWLDIKIFVLTVWYVITRKI